MPTPALAASVIVPSHRGAHRLPALLDALAAQDCAEPWEVVVVLDGVLDESPELLAAWQDRLPLRVLRSPDPRGVVAALNDGFAAARGRVLIRCDDDLTPAPHMVRRHVELHRGRDDLGVSCAMRDVVADSPYGRTYGAAAAARRLEQWYTRPAELRWVDWSAHNSVTRTAWDRLDHGFDPRFVYGQDSEVGYRLTRSGVTIVVERSLEVLHRGAAVSGANRIPRAYVAGASRALFSEVHGESHDRGAAGAESAPQRMWGAAVGGVAWAWRDWAHYQRLGRVVEAVTPHLPASLGQRLIALGVESAGRAGRLHGPRDLSTLSSQKARELARERAEDPTSSERPMGAPQHGPAPRIVLGVRPEGEPCPAASVVVPTRGGARRVATLLTLLEAQDTDDFEVVVVVDGDVDDTTGHLAGRGTALDLTVVTFPENRGRSAALNAGIDVARGRIVIRCDDDLEPAPSFVGRHVAAHGDGVRGVVGLYRNVFPDTPYARAYGRSADERFRRDAYRVPADEVWRYWAGNASVSAETARRVGPYDERFRAYGWEDVDWGYRLHLLDVPVVLEEGLETTHRLSAVTAASRVERSYFSGAARRHFVAKHDAGWLVPQRPRSAWTLAVRGVALLLTESTARLAGRVADVVGARLPRRVSRALVALLVEGASDAGYRRGVVSDPTAV